jgi:hypothetical protein
MTFSFPRSRRPGDGAGPLMIAWKQDNNGDTFVYSPWPLPWLETAADPF